MAVNDDTFNANKLHVMLCYVMLCYVMVMLCYVMLCYVMLCYFMLCYDNEANTLNDPSITYLVRIVRIHGSCNGQMQ